MNHTYFYFFDGDLPNLVFQLQLSLVTMNQGLHFHATGCTLNRKSFVGELMYRFRALIKNHFLILKKYQKV